MGLLYSPVIPFSLFLIAPMFIRISCSISVQFNPLTCGGLVDPTGGRKRLWKGTAFPAAGALPPMEPRCAVGMLLIVCEVLRNRKCYI